VEAKDEKEGKGEKDEKDEKNEKEEMEMNGSIHMYTCAFISIFVQT
jgi:hypothetical protein